MDWLQRGFGIFFETSGISQCRNQMIEMVSSSAIHEQLCRFVKDIPLLAVSRTEPTSQDAEHRFYLAFASSNSGTPAAFFSTSTNWNPQAKPCPIRPACMQKSHRSCKPTSGKICAPFLKWLFDYSSNFDTDADLPDFVYIISKAAKPRTQLRLSKSPTQLIQTATLFLFAYKHVDLKILRSVKRLLLLYLHCTAQTPANQILSAKIILLCLQINTVCVHSFHNFISSKIDWQGPGWVCKTYNPLRLL